MKVLLIFTFCVLAYAKPQYNYPAPAPTIPSVPSTASFGYGGYDHAQHYTGNMNEKFRGLNSLASSASAGVSSPALASFGGGIEGGTLVQKHIYVHVAPPEPEEVRPQRPISAGQSTKHYKIIFIKAPSYDLKRQQILQAQAQNEEKTLVYVLVKKPEDVADITLPTIAPTAPSKPEVYFIRYKARSEAVASGSASASVDVAGGSRINSEHQLIGGGSDIGSSLSVGSSSSSLSVGVPNTLYGPPGASGPY